MQKTWLRAIGAAIGILLLIIDSKTAISAAREAMELCVQSVIPSLFPFLILAPLLTYALTSLKGNRSRFWGRLLRIPAGMEGIFLAGLVSGYPVGAQLITNAYNNGQLDRHDAHRMLGFCSNCGPAFLFGIAGAKFAEFWVPWALWGIHILSAVLVAVFLPGGCNKESSSVTGQSVAFTQAVKAAITAMGYICAWVVLFRIILAFLDRWLLWLFPTELRVFIYGLLELANGCCALEMIPSAGLRFLVASTMLGFGGICVLMQTVSVTGGLGSGQYLIGKMLQVVFSLMLSFSLQFVLFPDESIKISPFLLLIPGLILFLFVLMGLKIKIRGGNPVKSGV